MVSFEVVADHEKELMPVEGAYEEVVLHCDGVDNVRHQ